MPPAAKAGKAAPKAGKQKEGEIKAKPKAFRVQVHIIEVKDVKPFGGGMPDVVCTASVGNYGTKYTQVVRQSTACTFDTHLEWKFMATTEEVNNSALQLRVLNANTDAKTESTGGVAQQALKLVKSKGEQRPA